MKTTRLLGLLLFLSCSTISLALAHTTWWYYPWANHYQDTVTNVNYLYYPSSGTAIVCPGSVKNVIESTLLGTNKYYTYRYPGSSVEGDIEILSEFTVDGKTYRVTGIGLYALTGNKITSVKIPSTVNSIDEFAFFGCNNLSSVSFSEGLTTIGTYAFMAVQNLLQLVFHRV